MEHRFNVARFLWAPPWALVGRAPPWALVGQGLVGAHGPLWAGALWAPGAPVGWALAGRPGPWWAGPLWGPWTLVDPPGPLHDGFAPVAPTIGHSPRDDRRRRRSWI